MTPYFFINILNFYEFFKFTPLANFNYSHNIIIK